MGVPVGMLLGELASAESFDDAAEVALRAAMDAVQGAIDRSPSAKRARVLRAMVHHRPDDGYRRLAVVEVGPDGSRGPVKAGDSEHLPSAAAWRWVRAHDAAAAIDVTTGAVMVASSAAGQVSAASAQFNAEESAARLRQRDATHVFVLPLRAPMRRIDGMLVIEANCRSAVGTPFVWEACSEDLMTVAGLAAQYFSRLPVTRVNPTSPDEFLPVIGASMQAVVEMLRVFARQEETILLSGPTGAGKSRLARWCHERSAVKSGPFETIDLATVPEELQLAELFGWKKGAFTSAVKDTPGAIARAERGTLFIDEIDKLSLSSQAGLLRVLEEKRYRQLGDSEADRSASVRFIIGTNADLARLSDDGKFRSDLYYRINVLPVRIPPLRARPDEIVDWARYMLQRRHAASNAKSEATITDEAARKLLHRDWPGNLRQLDNIVRRAYALSQMDQEASSDDVVLRPEHVERALEYEGKAMPRSLYEHLQRAAEAFVSEAERRVEGEERLDMDHCDAFKGLVIETAAARWPKDPNAVKKAFLLLGKEATVKSRNHGAHHEREMKVLERLRRFLGQSEAPPEEDG